MFVRPIVGICMLAQACSLTAEDLGGLPAYQRGIEVKGTLRVFGSDSFGVVELWEKGFQRYHPDCRFTNDLKSGDAFVGGLEAGTADIAISDREPVLTEYLSFYETFGHDLTDGMVTIATGAADIKGRNWAEVVFVNKDNPIQGLTLQQLDGIFGAERTGGYEGFRWDPKKGRGPEGNIRTWGQLGLTGEWADKPIHTYGYAQTGMTNFFQIMVMHGSDKWNPNYREYVEYATKMAPAGPDGERSNSRYMLADDLAQDKYGIAWSGIPHAAGVKEIKLVPLSREAGQPFVAPSRVTVQDRSYPLSRSIYAFINRERSKPMDPRVKEFLEYVLSREGQAEVHANNNYLPLNLKLVSSERGKLN